MEKFLNSTLVKLQISIILKIMLSFADFCSRNSNYFILHSRMWFFCCATLNCNLHSILSLEIICFWSEFMSESFKILKHFRFGVKVRLMSQDEASRFPISKSYLSCQRSWMQIACYFHNIRLEKFTRHSMHTRASKINNATNKRSKFSEENLLQFVQFLICSSLAN